MNRNIIIGGANGLLRDLDEQTSLGFKRKIESLIKNKTVKFLVVKYITRILMHYDIIPEQLILNKIYETLSTMVTEYAYMSFNLAKSVSLRLLRKDLQEVEPYPSKELEIKCKFKAYICFHFHKEWQNRSSFSVKDSLIQEIELIFHLYCKDEAKLNFYMVSSDIIKETFDFSLIYLSSLENDLF